MLNSTEKSILNLGQEASWSIHHSWGCQSRSGRVKILGQGKMGSVRLCRSMCFRIMPLSLNIWGTVPMNPMMPKLQDPSLCPDLERDPKYVFSCSQVFIKLVKARYFNDHDHYVNYQRDYCLFPLWLTFHPTSPHVGRSQRGRVRGEYLRRGSWVGDPLAWV